MTAKASSMRKAEAAVKNVGRLPGDFVATWRQMTASAVETTR